MLDTKSSESVVSQDSPESTPAPSVTPTPVAAALDCKPAKQPETYGQRIKKMSDRQLLNELRRKQQDSPGLKINQIFAVALTTIFENHIKGVNPYPR